MKFLFAHIIYYYFIFSFHVNILKLNANQIQCQIGAEGKCLGLVWTDIGELTDNIKPLYTKNVTIFKQCTRLCVYEKSCKMAVFEKVKQYCKIYEKASGNRIGYQNNQIFYWTCCNANEYNNPGRRCPGFWTYALDNRTTNSNRDSPLSTFHVDKDRCLDECLRNPICGSINTKIFTELGKKQYICELIIAFPIEYLQRSPSNGTSTYIWTCKNNYTITLIPNSCKNSKFRWSIESMSKRMSRVVNVRLQIYTMNYVDCLEYCGGETHCVRAWYNVATMHCLNEARDNSSCVIELPPNNNTYVTFKWHPCKLKKRVEKRAYKNCKKLVDNRHLNIAPNNCGRTPKKFVHLNDCNSGLCRNPRSSRQYYPCYRCQTNQSFVIVSQQSRDNMTWLRVFNGYETYWLYNVSQSTFTSSNDCDLFNAEMGNKDNIKVVLRKSWYAQIPEEKGTKFSEMPLRYVVITETREPKCGCLTRAACAETMRILQSKDMLGSNDINFNFLITGHSLVYEGVGWDVQSDGVRSVHKQSALVLALCGNFLWHAKRDIFSTTKRFINFAIKTRRLTENYTLLMMQDVDTQTNPAGALSRIIELWPHYRGHRKESCQGLTISIGVLNVVQLLVVCASALLLSHVFYFRVTHDKSCRSAEFAETISSRYCSLSGAVIQSSIYLHAVTDLQDREELISPFTTELQWIEDKTYLGKYSHCDCQRAFYSLFDLYRFQSKMVKLSVLSSLWEINACEKYTRFIFSLESELGLGTLMILHCHSESSLENFRVILQGRCCTCITFNTRRYDPSCSGLEMGMKCLEILRRGRSQYSSIIEDVRPKYCYVKDRCLRFY